MPALDDAQSFHVILVAGPPASGKGTVCTAIARRYGLVYISLGTELHEAVESGSALGLKVQKHMEAAEQVPTDLFIELLQHRLSRPDVLGKGCLLDSFPVTAEQAKALNDCVRVDAFIRLTVTDEVVIERALERRVDPVTGELYHLTFKPPPPEIASLSRLVRRTDDDLGRIRARLRAYNEHIESVSAVFDGHCIDATNEILEVREAVLDHLDRLEWTTEDSPYFGSVAFTGPFDATDAKRAGFYSPENPPEVGEHVVSFRRGDKYDTRGVVADVEETISNGAGGLRKGVEGQMVTIAGDDGNHFQSWSAFLAPVNDMEYSAICTNHDFSKSTFAHLYSCSRGLADADVISREDARESVKHWLENLLDRDDEELEIQTTIIEATLAAFDEHDESSLYLYSTNQALAPRTSLVPGHDYSVYYKALNNTLNADSEENLKKAMPLIRRMIFLLLYTEDGEQRKHEGGRVWKGDIQRPVPLNMNRLREACALKKVVRFRQFQSTTTDEKLADKYRKREDGRGYKWVIDIPKGFWGARDIKDISWRSGEAETLFPAYSAFLVESVDDHCCHLTVLDRSAGLSRPAARHGLLDDKFRLDRVSGLPASRPCTV